MDEWTIRGMHEEEGGRKWIFWLSDHTFNEYMHEGMEWKKWHDGMNVWRYETLDEHLIAFVKLHGVFAYPLDLKLL